VFYEFKSEIGLFNKEKCREKHYFKKDRLSSYKKYVDTLLEVEIIFFFE